MNLASSLSSTYFSGNLLIAVPLMPDPRFFQTVIYLCAHSAKGARGLIVNKPMKNVTFPQLLKELSIPAGDATPGIPVHEGGPVEAQRGFVLHSGDYHGRESQFNANTGIGLTMTTEILRDIAQGQGPRHSMLALGCAVWEAGQLEEEIHADGWLVCPSDPSFLFAGDDSEKWRRAIGGIGIDPLFLSSVSGHA